MGNQENKAARENAEDLEEPPDELRNLWHHSWTPGAQFTGSCKTKQLAECASPGNCER